MLLCVLHSCYAVFIEVTLLLFADVYVRCAQLLSELGMHDISCMHVCVTRKNEAWHAMEFNLIYGRHKK